MTNMAYANLKGRFLTAIGHVLADHKSHMVAFDRLRTENPDLFPVQRATESFWDAVTEVVTRVEAAEAARRPYTVDLWGSNPDETGNDDCWTGDSWEAPVATEKERTS